MIEKNRTGKQCRQDSDGRPFVAAVKIKD